MELLRGAGGYTHRSLSQEIIRKHYTVAALAVIGRVTNTRIFLFNVRYGSCGGAVSQSGMEGLCQLELKVCVALIV